MTLIIKQLKRYRWQIMAFLLALVPRLVLNSMAIPLRTLSDELATISSAAYLAGKDWSGVVSGAGYYGFGFSVLFAPLFALTDDPVILYRGMLAGASLMQSVPALIAYYLLVRFFHAKEGVYTALASVACSYMAVTRTMIVYNEHGIILCAWLLTWFLLEVFCANRENNPKKRLFYSCLFMLVMGYSLLLHTRSVIFFYAFGVLFVLYLFMERKMLCSIASVPLGIGVYLLSKQAIAFAQHTLWKLEEGERIRNGAVKLAFSLDFLKVGYRRAWFSIVAGQINTVAVITGGVLIIGMVLGGIGAFLYFKKSLSQIGGKKDKPDTSENPFDWYMFGILFYFGMMILATVFAQSLKWLGQTMEAVAQGPGTWMYGMKAVTYVRYIGPFLGPVLLIVLAYIGRITAQDNADKGHKKQKGKGKNTGFQPFLPVCAGGALTLILHAVWRIVVYPYVWNNTYACECYLPFAFQNIRNLDMSKNIYMPATVISVFMVVLLVVLVCERKSTVFLFIFTAFLMYQYCYNAVGYDRVSQKDNYAQIDRTVEFVRNMASREGLSTEEIHVVDVRDITDHQTYYLYQMYFDEYKVVQGVPQADAQEAIILTNSGECPAVDPENYVRFALDENEYVWIKGADLLSLTIR